MISVKIWHGTTYRSAHTKGEDAGRLGWPISARASLALEASMAERGHPLDLRWREEKQGGLTNTVRDGKRTNMLICFAGVRTVNRVNLEKCKNNTQLLKQTNHHWRRWDPRHLLPDFLSMSCTVWLWMLISTLRYAYYHYHYQYYHHCRFCSLSLLILLFAGRAPLSALQTCTQRLTLFHKPCYNPFIQQSFQFKRVLW